MSSNHADLTFMYYCCNVTDEAVIEDANSDEEVLSFLDWNFEFRHLLFSVLTNWIIDYWYFFKFFIVPLRTALRTMYESEPNFSYWCDWSLEPHVSNFKYHVPSSNGGVHCKKSRILAPVDCGVRKILPHGNYLFWKSNMNLFTAARWRYITEKIHSGGFRND